MYKTGTRTLQVAPLSSYPLTWWNVNFEKIWSRQQQKKLLWQQRCRDSM